MAQSASPSDDPGSDAGGAADDRSPSTDDKRSVPVIAIVEAILFVGHQENRCISAAELARVISDADEDAVRQAVSELNSTYQQQQSALTIVSQNNGYRLELRPELHSVRDRFYGRIRQVKLSQQAMEVLAVIAYRQPITADDVEELRGTDSRRIIRQLVRRQLLRVERNSDQPRRLHYRTTERFLKLFRLAKLDDLPRDEEIERS